jgi:hypothetical protein
VLGSPFVKLRINRFPRINLFAQPPTRTQKKTRVHGPQPSVTLPPHPPSLYQLDAVCCPTTKEEMRGDMSKKPPLPMPLLSLQF